MHSKIEEILAKSKEKKQLAEDEKKRGFVVFYNLYEVDDSGNIKYLELSDEEYKQLLKHEEEKQDEKVLSSADNLDSIMNILLFVAIVGWVIVVIAVFASDGAKVGFSALWEGSIVVVSLYITKLVLNILSNMSYRLTKMHQTLNRIENREQK